MEPIGQPKDFSHQKGHIRASLVTAILIFLILLGALKLHKIELAIPFGYNSGNIFLMVLTKGITAHEWSPFLVPRSKHLSAPFDFSLHDIPQMAGSNLVFLTMSFISLFTKDYVQVNNIFSLLSFFLIAFSALYAFRVLRISFKIAAVLGILFAFLPYHFEEQNIDLGLVYYTLVPLMGLILIWMWSRKPIFFKRISGRYHADFGNFKSIFSLVVLSLAGMGAPTYNIFFCFFAVIAGFSAFFYRKSVHHLVAAFILITALGAAVLVSWAPYIYAQITHGANREGLVRVSAYAAARELSVTQLFLPVDGHRISLLAELRERCMDLPVFRQHSTPAVGIVAAMGLLSLLFGLLFGAAIQRTLYFKLSTLAIAGILFAGIAGPIGVLLNFSHIIGFNGISIFLAYFGLTALGLALSRFENNIAPLFMYMALAGLLVIGIGDQIPHHFKLTYGYETRRQDFLSDREFVKAIEKTAPPNAMIFQLPFIPFPAKSRVNNMSPYDHLKGYLHSDTLRWSGGAMRGRYPAFWYLSTAEAPMDQMLYRLSLAGFSGIYIDRNGYSDLAAALETNFSGALQKPPLVSRDGKLSYFDITGYSERIIIASDQNAWNELRDTAVFPIQDIWEGDFYSLENNEKESWRWCGNHGTLTLINPSNRDRQALLHMEFTPDGRDPQTLLIRGDEFFTVLRMSDQEEKVEKTVIIPAKSKIVIRLSSNGQHLNIPTDPRWLMFAVRNARIEEPTSPLQGQWGRRFYGLEKKDNLQWRWCGSEGTITFSNPSSLPKQARLHMEFGPERQSPYEIVIKSKDILERIQIEHGRRSCEKTINVAPNEIKEVEFSCAAPPLLFPTDPRKLVFAIYNLSYRTELFVRQPEDRPSNGRMSPPLINAR